MLRDSRYKFVYYVGAEPQLFDLDSDPKELRNLAREPGAQGLVRRYETHLRKMMDPEETDRRAKADQRSLIGALGGVEAVLRAGTFGNSPVPGETPAVVKYR